MEKILIIEDDIEIAKIQQDYLEKEGYDVRHAKTGLSGITFFEKFNPDLIILDLNLPEIDGYEVCRRIRKFSGVPIIMVTAKTKEIDELLGLEIGADDYVKKPFSPKILVSRVKALLKRPELIENKNHFEHSDFKIDLDNHTVLQKDNEIDFTSIQFNMFLKMIRKPGRVYSREELIDNTGATDIFDRTIDSHIKNIRKLIEIDPKNPKYILTVRGVGYKFNEEI